MTRKITLLLLAIMGVLWGLPCYADDESNTWIESVKTGQYSETNEILVEEYTYRLSPNEGYKHEIWLVSASDASQRKLLYTHFRNAEVLFSPNDQWLFINNHFCSNEAGIFLFRKKKGIEFEQSEILTDKAWAFLEKKTGKKVSLDHSYAEVVRWTDDDTVLISLQGHADSKNHVSSWLCFYNVTTKTFSTDLDAQNKRHVTLEPQK